MRPFAVVTGASSGIGYEVARILGKEGFDLLIVAEDAEIEGAERELSDHTSVKSLQIDLSDPSNVERLHEVILDQCRPVDALVLNAGIGAGGSFAAGTTLGHDLKLIDLNVKSIVHLLKLEIEPMVARDEGKVFFTPAVASTRPGAHQAVYNATTSFVQSFALALRNELTGTGVSVTSLIPAPTDTVSGATGDSGTLVWKP